LADAGGILSETIVGTRNDSVPWVIESRSLARFDVDAAPEEGAIPNIDPLRSHIPGLERLAITVA
jgi:hypothetical protein